MYERSRVTQPRVLVSMALMAIVLIGGWTAPVRAQENEWGFGTDVGFWAETADDTLFALSFNADYYFDRAFSLGPMVLFTPAGDLFQVAVAAVARYHIDLKAINVVPLAGIGFVHSELEQGQGASRVDVSDTSYYLPLGIGLEWPMTRKLAVSSTLLVNLHGLDFGSGVGKDGTSLAVMFGMRFRP